MIGEEKYMELSRKIYDFHAENLYMIGVVGMVPMPFIVKKNIGNLPTAFLPHMGDRADLNYYMVSLFYK
jgi:hypothetical protein